MVFVQRRRGDYDGTDSVETSGAEAVAAEVCRINADFWQKAGASTWSSRIAHYTGYEIRVKEIRLPHPIFRVIGKTLFP